MAKTTDTMNHKFNRIAVMGSGTMGAQIAALCVNLNIPVTLFEISLDLLEQNLAKLAKSKPPALASKEALSQIEKATYDDDLEKLRHCDFIIEAIVEQVKPKQELFQKIAPYLLPEAVIATNTSGLSIETIASVLPASHQEQFCGVHFFNPPRFMALVELIPAQSTSLSTLNRLAHFMTAYLGKEVVFAKDTAAFIGNRLGVMSLLIIFHHAQRLGIAPDTVDVLTGKLTGKSSTGSYRTADLVGLDILKHVVDHISENEKDESWSHIIKLPDWLEQLIQDGKIGQKSQMGVYQKKGDDILVFDSSINDYRPQNKSISSAVKKLFSQNLQAEILPEIVKSKDPQLNFLWSVYRDTMHYAANHLEEIASSVDDVDRAICAGFGWKEGIFEWWQRMGVNQVNQWITEDIEAGKTVSKAPLADWVMACGSFYQESLAYFPEKKTHLPVKTNPVYERQIHAESFRVLLETDEICLNEISESVAAIYFKTKLATISYGVLTGINEALDLLEKESYSVLIFWNPKGGTFCAGANLYQVLMGCKLGRLYDDGGLTAKAKQKAFELTNSNLPKIDYSGSIIEVIALGQSTMQRLKYGPLYTIAAVDGLAIGGGCEIILHCNHVIATQNSYIGLVEVAVGILPAFGGSKEMLLRAEENAPGLDLFPWAAKHFEQIARAKVSSSAQEAMEMGYLKRGSAIVANQKELLYSARECAKSVVNQATYTTLPPQSIRTIGQTGKANIFGQLTNLREGDFISEHDFLIASSIAEIFSGEVDDGECVSEQWLLNLERKYFMKLLETNKTRSRIEHMLKQNKPLRN